MKKLEQPPSELSKLKDKPLSAPSRYRGPGRGVGEKRISRELLTQLDNVFENIQITRRFLASEGHHIINESGSLVAPQAHKNLDQLITLLEDFLWILNCTIAKHGGKARLI